MSSFVFVDIINLLSDAGVTYNNADEVLCQVKNTLKTDRELKEYDTYEDFYARRKSRELGDSVIEKIINPTEMIKEMFN